MESGVVVHPDWDFKKFLAVGILGIGHTNSQLLPCLVYIDLDPLVSTQRVPSCTRSMEAFRCAEVPILVLARFSRACWVVVDRKSTRLNSSHVASSYAVFCLKKKRQINRR